MDARKGLANSRDHLDHFDLAELESSSATRWKACSVTGVICCSKETIRRSEERRMGRGWTGKSALVLVRMRWVNDYVVLRPSLWRRVRELRRNGRVPQRE